MTRPEPILHDLISHTKARLGQEEYPYYRGPSVDSYSALELCYFLEFLNPTHPANIMALMESKYTHYQLDSMRNLMIKALSIKVIDGYYEEAPEKLREHLGYKVRDWYS